MFDSLCKHAAIKLQRNWFPPLPMGKRREGAPRSIPVGDPERSRAGKSPKKSSVGEVLFLLEESQEISGNGSAHNKMSLPAQLACLAHGHH